MKRLLLLPIFGILAACGSGGTAIYMDVGKTQFVGETENSLRSGGDFLVTSPDNVICEGSYSFTQSLSGKGKVVCSDNSEGSFVFTSEKNKLENVMLLIKGIGKFKDGRKFTITFGETAVRYIAPTSGYGTENPIYQGQSTPSYKGQIDINLP